MRARLAGYPHFARLAARLEWDEAEIDLTNDARNWGALRPDPRRRVESFVAAFLFAEERVAADLAPFIRAAPDDAMAKCFRLQARDEERHSRFFARYAEEVIGPADLRALVPTGVAELFEERLRAGAEALARGEAGLGEAVALYHLILEGVVFSCGQATLLADLPEELPGLRQGLELVTADERWHIGFGARVLQDCPLEEAQADALVRDGTDAAAAWNGLVPEARVEAVARLHRRRLAAAGIT